MSLEAVNRPRRFQNLPKSQNLEKRMEKYKNYKKVQTEYHVTVN